MAFVSLTARSAARPPGEVRAFIGPGSGSPPFCLKSGAEEKLMRSEFAEENARYSQRVKRLIPFVL